MASPSVAIARFDLSLSYSEFSLMASRLGYIGLQVLPPIGVAKDSGSFAKISVEDLLRKIEDTEREPRATYKRDTFQWATDSYDAKEHGVEEVVDDLLIERYGDILRSEAIATQRAIHRVLQALENAIAAAVFNTSTWTGATLTTAASVAWTTPATAVPITDIDNAIEKVKVSSGMKPNALVLSDYALQKLKRTAQVQDLLKYSGKDDPKNLGVIDGLKTMFDLEKVLVGRGVKNTADEGQSASFSRFWTQTMAMVCHVRDDGMEGDLESMEPCIGRTIFASEGNASIPGAGDGEESLIMEEYREENRRGGIIRARNKRMVKILHAEAGHLITAVTA